MMKASNLVTGDRELVVPPTGASVQSLPSITWPVMSVERYAALEQALGAKVLRTGDIWWVQIRPFFYRPLLPFERYDVGEVNRLVGHRGVFQHAVREGQAHNSYLNPVIFDDLHNYDSRLLRKNVRGSLKKGMASGATVRAIVDEAEFCEKAYPTYLSFYMRTGYRFAESRKKKAAFSKWARTLFQFPDLGILGVFLDTELVAFEVVCLVKKTLMIKTVVTSDAALKVEASDLLLHHCRESVREQSEVELITYGSLCSNTTLNRFKTMRGARVLALPSRIDINPLLLWSIKKSTPAIYSKLCGVDPTSLVRQQLAPGEVQGSSVAN